MRTMQFGEKWSMSEFKFADKSDIDRTSVTINLITMIF